MHYPSLGQDAGLSARQKLTYCLGTIAEIESELCSQLRDGWQIVFDIDPETRARTRITSGKCLELLAPALRDERYEWLGSAREALPLIEQAVRDRNDALHSEWFNKGAGFISLPMIRQNLAPLDLGHFEAIAHRLDVAADNALGIVTLVRLLRAREQGSPVARSIERINRNLAAKRP